MDKGIQAVGTRGSWRGAGALSEAVGAAVAAGVEDQSAGLVAEVALEQEVDERPGGAAGGELVRRRPGERVERGQAVLGAAPDDVGGPVGALQQRAAVDPDRAADPALDVGRGEQLLALRVAGGRQRQRVERRRGTSSIRTSPALNSTGDLIRWRYAARE